MRVLECRTFVLKAITPFRFARRDTDSLCRSYDTLVNCLGQMKTVESVHGVSAVNGFDCDPDAANRIGDALPQRGKAASFQPV